MDPIRVFPRKTKWTPTDRLAFVGEPSLFGRPIDAETPVLVSCTFTWDMGEALRLQKSWSRFYCNVQIGGPAFGDRGGEFTPGLFVKEGAVTTSRGCVRRCGFCLVPEREGALREIAIEPGWNLFDNNLLACSREHVEAVFEMLSTQKEPAIFSGGLDARLFESWHVSLLEKIRVKAMFFACDSPAAIVPLQKVAGLMAGFSREKKRCYVLVGWNGETPKQAGKRLEAVYDLDFLPFAMLYRGPDAGGRNTREFHDLIGVWRSPAAYKAKMKRRAV